MSVTVTAATHRGTERERNEDAVGAAGWQCREAREPVELRPLGNEPVVTVVADGVGGHPGGDVASALAVEHLLAAAPGIGSAEALSGAMVAAHHHVADQQRARALEGMASTAAVLVVTDDAVLVGNVGDSRVYELHDGQLLQLSIDDGGGTAVTQVLGGYGGLPAPHVSRLQREPALRFLLCTDGLIAALGEEGVTEVIARHAPDWPLATGAAINEALRRGSPDNLSLAIVEVDA